MNKYGLNDEQWDVINSGAIVFCNASAGAGKTKTLVTKVQYLLDSGAEASSILAATFTNKAANEMKDRLKKYGDVSKMQISTIHSMCVRIIRKFIGHTYLKYPFTIYDTSNQTSVVKSIVKSGALSDEPYEYLSAISNLKSKGILPDKVIEVPTNGTGQELDRFLKVYKQYQEILRQNNSCDFDDLLILARDCLLHEDCKKYYSNLWTHILVDEVQDTSKIQYDIITKLYDPQLTKTMFLVGDKSQSVYSWRNAHPQNIDDFIKTYNAKTKFLSYNYRSCSDVINIANKFQQYGKPMIPKTATTGKVSVTEFRSLEDEAEKIAQALLKMGNYNNTAIIYRMNSRSLYFEQIFSKYRIPYKVVNELPFFQRRVCKDLLSALAASNNPEDRSSLARVINTPKRGFGDVKKIKLMEQGRAYLTENMNDLPLIKPFIKLLDDIKGMPPARALAEYLNRSGYWDTVDKDSDRYMIKALQDVVVAFPTVEELILASTFLEKDSGDGVNLITAHGSKGLEYDRVFVVGLEEGVWPHKSAEDLDEERRLYYVACTRAKKYLNLSYSKARNFRGTLLSNSPSQLFLDSYNHLHP
jgi:DNA helicase-2/ATP-dependent DNA helicase PcrA